MRLSVNELENLVRKAAIGAGLGHGHAYEASRSLLRLAAIGINGVPDLVHALRAWADGRSGPITRECRGNTCRLKAARDGPACVLNTAPALRDFAELLAKTRRFERIEAYDVPCPAWVIGQIAIESWPTGITLYCLENGGTTVRWAARATGNSRAFILSGSVEETDAADLHVAASDFEYDTGIASPRPERTLAPDMSPLYNRGVKIAGEDYDALKYYSGLTLVPDSDASRQHGAGAGLVDSD